MDDVLQWYLGYAVCSFYLCDYSTSSKAVNLEQLIINVM